VPETAELACGFVACARRRTSVGNIAGRFDAGGCRE
jgi:hypothetical protein